MDITIFASENRRIHFEISKLFTRACMLAPLPKSDILQTGQRNLFERFFDISSTVTLKYGLQHMLKPVSWCLFGVYATENKHRYFH